jgi:ribosomal protein S18 acetylase RimI-like enzyme
VTTVTLPTALLAAIESYYDAVPRPVARTEEVGPFTLFVAEEGTGWQFYARPRLGGTDDFTADDVRRVLARQGELGLPRAIEWVDETTPSLLPAVREVLAPLMTGATEGKVDLELCPLLVLPEDVEVAAEPSVRVLDGDDPDLATVTNVVHAGFEDTDDIVEQPIGRRRELVRDGILVVVAAYADGEVAGGGSSAPRGDGAELMGIAVPPAYRKRGLGSALTRGLVNAVRERGARTVLLSAASDDAASIYRKVGFVDVGTACILEVPEAAELVRLDPDHWELLRDVRLRALADSPDAFGSPYDREAAFTEQDWRRRLVGPVCAVLVAGWPVAMGGAFTRDGRLQIWGMWTDPDHRGRGHARRLLHGLLGDSLAEGQTVALHVNTTNDLARRFYESFGFAGTGELESLRPGSDQRIELMLWTAPRRG